MIPMKIKDDEYLGFYQAKVAAAVFSSVMVLVFALIFWLMRLGLDNNSPFFLFKIAAVGYFLIHLPNICMKIAGYFGRQLGKLWYTSDAIIYLSGLLGLILAGLFLPEFNVFVLMFIVILGCLFFIVNMVDYFSSGTKISNFIFLAIAVLFTLAMGVMFTKIQGTPMPLMFEDFVRGYLPFEDFYHHSICQMIKTYGIPSTGLDGVPYLPYHYGSHFAFAQISKLMGINTIIFYQYCYIIIFLPFLFNSMFLFVINLRKYLNKPFHNWDLRQDYWFWVALALPFLGFLPTRILNRLYTKEWILVSQSYTLGMSLLFSITSLLFYFFKNFKSHENRFRIGDFIFLILFLPILLTAMGMTKQSLLFLFFVGACYLSLRLKLYKNMLVVFSLIIIFVYSICVSRLATYKYEGVFNIVFFDHIRRFVVADKRNSLLYWIVAPPAFYVVHFFWSWIYIWLRLLQEKAKSFASIINLFKVKKILDAELILVLCIAGALPGILLKIKGGVAAYFSDVQRWVSIAFLLGRFSGFSLADLGSHLKKSKILVFVVLFIGITSAVCNLALATKMTFKECFIALDYLYDLTKKDADGRPKPAGYSKKVGYLADVQQALYNNKYYRMYKTLLDLDKLPLSEKRKTLIFIPRSNKLFWDSYDPRGIAMAPAALSGIAMIDGIPSVSTESEKLFPGHMFAFYIYGVATIDPATINPDPQKVYSRVLKRGFSRLIIMDNKDGETIITKIPTEENNKNVKR